MPIMMLAALLLQAAGEGPPKARGFVMPPKAAEVTGEIRQVELSPIFAADFVCSQHFLGQVPYAGDALGADCMVTGGIEGDSGYLRFFRTDGRTNSDWYGWKADVLSPADATVIGVLAKDEENVPGTLGRPPAGMLQLRTADGVIISLGHVTGVLVKLRDRVKAGQPVATVGNNGFARAPHIHIGAWREATAEPLQIRWDLRAMSALRARPATGDQAPADKE